MDTARVVNPRTGAAEVIGHVPLPLSGAGARMLDGVVYIAGGRTARYVMCR